MPTRKREIDWDAEGLLEGLNDDGARRDRIDLLEELHQAGVSLAILRQAVAESRLALLPAERILVGDAGLTIAEVADAAGLEEDLLARNMLALGLPRPDPDEPAFGEEDVSAAKILKTFIEAGIPEEGLIQTSRVIGQAMANIAGATLGLAGEAFMEPGDTELGLGRRYAGVTEALTPLMERMLGYQLRLHLRDGVRRAVLSQDQIASGRGVGAREIAVAFADLVGFTRLGERLPVEEIGGLAGRLAEMAGDVAEPPVRLVKTIGDAAMLVAPEAEPLLVAVLALVELTEAEGEEFPQLRAGVALGEAVTRGGDWYGRPVNTASRITGIAYPGSVLATEEVRASAGDAFEWSPTRPRHLKGIPDRIQLYRARLAVPEAAAGDA